MTTVAELQAKLSMDAGEYFSTTAKVNKETASMVEGIQRAAEQLSHIVEFFAVKEAVEGLIEFTKAGAEAADQIDTLMQKTGESAEQVQEYGYIARITGTSQEALAGATDHLSKSMAAAASGSGEQAQAFKAMGISVTDSEGKLRPLNDVLGNIADKFKSYADGPAKAALAQILLGKSGADLIPTLNKGSDGYRELSDEAKALGGILSDETLAAAVKTGEEFKKMDAIVYALKIRMAGDLEPATHELADALHDADKEGSLVSATTEALEGAYKLAASAAIFLGEWVLEIGNDIGATAAQITAVVNGEFSRVGAIHEEMISKDIAMQQEASDRIKAIWSGAATGPKSQEQTEPKVQAPIIKQANDAKAAYAVLNAEMKAALELEKEVDREREAALQDSYKTGGLDLQSYYQERLAIEQAGAAKEMDLIRAQISQTEALKRNANPQEQLGLQAKLVELNGRLQLAEKKRNDAALDSARELTLAIQEQAHAMQALAIAGEDQRSKASIANQVDALNYQHELMQVSDQQYFAKLKQLEDDSYAQAQKIEQEKYDNFIGTNDQRAQAAAQLTNTLEQLEIDHQQKMTKIDQDGTKNRLQYVLEAQGEIKASVADEIAGLEDGSKKAQDAFHDLLTSVLKDIDQLVAKNLAESLLGNGSSGGNLLGGLLGTVGQHGSSGGAGSGAAGAGLLGEAGNWLSGLFGGSSGAAGTSGNPVMVGGDWSEVGLDLGGAYAAGGDPPVGKMSLVGEDGPELFVPATAGSIIPNDQLGSMGAPKQQIIQQFTVMAPQGRIAKQSDMQVRNAAGRAVMAAQARS